VWDGFPIHGSGSGGEVAEMVDGEVHVRPRLGERFPVVEDFELGERLGVCREAVGHRLEECLPVSWRRVGPPLLVGVPRGVDCPIDVLRSPFPDGHERFAGRRVHRRERVVDCPATPLATDEVFERAVRQQIVGEVAVSTFDNFESCL